MRMTPSRFRRAAGVILGLAALTLRAQSADPALPPYMPGPQVSGHVNGVTGMDSVEAMYGAWADAFKKYHPNAQFTIESKDVGPEERIALGDKVSEVFHPTSDEYENTYGYEPFRVKICMGAYVLKSHVSAIGVYVNKANPLSQLSLKQLDAIFSEERRRGYPAPISTWGQAGAGGEFAETPVHPIGFYWKDDVTSYFRLLVMHGAPFNPAYRIPGDDMTRRTPLVGKAIMAEVEKDPGAIAFGNFSYKTDNVKAIALVDDRGVVSQPVLTDIASGQYPLQRYLYFYVNRKPGTPLNPLVKEFLSFVLSREGQDLVQKDHYLPLTPRIAAEERAKLE